jgi:Tfp pilus assembly protein PilF
MFEGMFIQTLMACEVKFVTSYIFCSFQVLEIESCNVKALYRRAQAYVESYDLELAKRDVLKALELDPNNKCEHNLLSCYILLYV